MTTPNLGPAYVSPTENRPYVTPAERQAAALERIAIASAPLITMLPLLERIAAALEKLPEREELSRG